MKYLVLFICILSLTGCQLSFSIPKTTSETPDKPAMNTKQTQSNPLAVHAITIDIPAGKPIIAHPYWRWQYDHLKMSLSDACNVSIRYRAFNSTLKWDPAQHPFGSWEKIAPDVVEKSLQRLGYTISQNNQSLDTTKRLIKARLLLSAKITDMRGNMCHTTYIPFFATGGQDAGDVFIHITWQLYDQKTNHILGSFDTDGLGYVETPIQNGGELILINAIQDATINLGHNPDFIKTIQNLK